jgi:hypothetical protein
MGSKHDLTTTQENHVIAIEMHPICAEYELETQLAISVEIRIIDAGHAAHLLDYGLHKPISTRGTSHVYSPYSAHIGCKSFTQIKIT